MIKCLILIASIMFSTLILGGEHQMIDTLGISSKGQYVAIEEYGYRSQSHSYYVTIKVMNVWKKIYVGQAIEVELPAHRPSYLQKARTKARFLATEHLKTFGISA